MDKLNQALDLFTEGLRSDPEIRLDVRHELQSRLEERVAEEIAGGHSSAESTELALQAFGSPVEVADCITAANRQRMKFRSKMRILAGLLLVPAVIICAFFSLGLVSCLLRMTSDLQCSFSHCIPDLFLLDDKLFNPSKKLFSLDFFRSYTPEQEMLLYGKPKDLWDKFPDNKIYAANYVLEFLSGDNIKDRNFCLAEINRVSQLDPHNALYNYLAAGLMLQDACEEIKLPREGKNGKLQYRFNIKDRVLLEKAMREYLTGVNKKYCNSYSTDFLKQRLQCRGYVDSLAGQLEQIALAGSTLLPQFQHYKTIGRLMPEYAGFLITDGKKQEALQYLNTWQQFIQHVNSDGDWFIGELVTAAVADSYAEKLPPLYDKVGMTETAKNVAINTENISKPVREFKEKQLRIMALPRQHSGCILGDMLLIGFGRELTNEDLAPLRYAEYVYCQKILLAVISLALIIGVIFAMGAALYWRFRGGDRLLLLVPPPMTVLKIIGLGSILPGIAYFALSHVELISGYNFGILINSTRFAAQAVLLLLIIPGLVLTLSCRYVADRCCELGVTVPSPSSGRIQQKVIIAVLLLLITIAFAPLSMLYSQTSQSMTATVLIVGQFTVAAIIILQCVQYGKVLFLGNEYSIYCGAAAKMLMLTFALTILVLTCIFRPVLDWREADFIRQDKIIFGATRGILKIEDDVCKELKSKIDQAMTKI